MFNQESCNIKADRSEWPQGLQESSRARIEILRVPPLVLQQFFAWDRRFSAPHGAKAEKAADVFAWRFPAAVAADLEEKGSEGDQISFRLFVLQEPIRRVWGPRGTAIDVQVQQGWPREQRFAHVNAIKPEML